MPLGLGDEGMGLLLSLERAGPSLGLGFSGAVGDSAVHHGFLGAPSARAQLWSGLGTQGGPGLRWAARKAQPAPARCLLRFARAYAGAAAGESGPSCSPPGALALKTRPFCLDLAPWRTSPGPAAAGCPRPWVDEQVTRSAVDAPSANPSRGRVWVGGLKGVGCGPGGGLRWRISRAETGFDGRSRGA